MAKMTMSRRIDEKMKRMRTSNQRKSSSVKGGSYRSSYFDQTLSVRLLGYAELMEDLIALIEQPRRCREGTVLDDPWFDLMGSAELQIKQILCQAVFLISRRLQLRCD